MLPVEHSAPSGSGERTLIHDSTYSKTSQELIQFVTTLRGLGYVFEGGN